MADQKQLVRFQPRTAGEIIEHRHRPADRELVRQGELRRTRRVVGVPLDANDLVGIGPLELAGHTVDQGGSVEREVGRARLEESIGRELEPHHIAILAHFDAWNVEHWKVLGQAVVGRDGRSHAAT